MRIAAGFLVSETECERNFAVERRQFDHRPSAREDGFKIIVGGLPIERVQHSNRFWLLVQERYVEIVRNARAQGRQAKQRHWQASAV